MWANESVFYQIYPLGFCGAPFENDGVLEHRILKVLEWVEHIEKLGCNAVYFSPVFESDTHGYNTSLILPLPNIRFSVPWYGSKIPAPR